MFSTDDFRPMHSLTGSDNSSRGSEAKLFGIERLPITVTTSLGPTLARTLGQRRLETRVVFSTSRLYAGRKEAARATQAEVELLRRATGGHAARTESASFLLTRV